MTKTRLFLRSLILGAIIMVSATAFAYDNLYLIGDATPAGWNIAAPTPMTQDVSNVNIFTYSGPLSAGELKFSAFADSDWCAGDWLLATAADQVLTATDYLIYSGCAPGEIDFKWKVDAEDAGNYTITVNFDLETIVFTKESDPIENLYLVGDATPNGWDIDNATAMTVDPSNAFVFTYEGTLTAGAFKIATAKSFDPGYEWIMPLTDGQSLTETSYQVVVSSDGGTDYKWAIDEETIYKITVDLANETIHIGAPYSTLFLVGDATTAGWNSYGTEETTFTRDADNIYLFTFTGALTAGYLKIHLESGDWADGEWMVASQADQVLTAVDYIITTDALGPDNKWVVSAEEAGDYTITVDFKNATIGFVKNSAPSVNLYLVGDATPNGWDIDNATPMVGNAGLTVFTWEGTLAAGVFKIATEKTFDAGYEWIMPVTDGQSLTETSYQVVVSSDGGTDFKWVIVEEATYKITVDLENETIQIGSPYPALYLVGDATPNGWDIDNATIMTRDASSTFIFTWHGSLTEGAFKIATEKTWDDGYDFIHPLTQGQLFTSTDYEIVVSGSGTDNQWVVGSDEAGDYTITVDLQSETIEITADVNTSINHLNAENAILRNTVANNHLFLNTSEQMNYQIYSISGAQISSGYTQNGVIQTNEFSNGIFIIKLVSKDNKHYTQKFMVNHK